MERMLLIRSRFSEYDVEYLLTKILQVSCFFGSGAISKRVPQHKKDQPENNIRYAKNFPDNRSSLYFMNCRKVSVTEEELPKVNAHQVLVKTMISAISPGTESLIYRGEFPSGVSIDENIASLSNNFAYPMKYGYSVVGKVVEIGNSIEPIWKDRMVLAFHPHETHFIADPKMLLPLPDDIKPEDGVFLPNMETAINFLMDGSPIIGERVAVFGQGIVGLLTTSLLARLLLAKLVTLDKYSLRRQASLEAGAHICLDPEDPGLLSLLQKHLSNGADLTYEISGSPDALDQALIATGFAGRIVIGSWYGSKHSCLDLGGKFHRSRISLISSQVSSIAPEFCARWTKARRFEVAWEMIRQCKPSRFITHRFPFEEAAQAYRLLDETPEKAIQILLTYED